MPRYDCMHMAPTVIATSQSYAHSAIFISASVHLPYMFLTAQIQTQTQTLLELQTTTA